MRKGVLFFLVYLIGFVLYAQPPAKISYQAQIRDAGNNLVANSAVGLRMSILQGTETGTVVFAETHTPTTDAWGLASLEIGGGTAVTGTLAGIDWSAGPYFLKMEADPAGGTNYTISGTTQFLSVPYALNASNSAVGAEGVKGDTGPQGSPGVPGTDSPTYTVGQFAQGGIVFWVDETGHHGLVCAKTDQSTGVRWYAGTYGNTQAKGDGPFAGKANTAIIIASQVAIGDDGATYAARICNELSITEGSVTYNDWYLPSKEELNLMYQNKAVIDATALANGGTAFASDYYWSSSEKSSIYAWFQGFGGGGQGNDLKSYTSLNTLSLRVRAVRAF